MSHPNDKHPNGPGSSDRCGEGVGSVGEEATKLFTLLSGWAKDQGYAQSESAERAAQGIAEALRTVDTHVATGGNECRYCPVCQMIHAVRETSPEVRQHLVAAAGSLLHAAAGVLATQVPRPKPAPGVQKIDLGAEGDPWDDEAAGAPDTPLPDHP